MVVQMIRKLTVKLLTSVDNPHPLLKSLSLILKVVN